MRQKHWVKGQSPWHPSKLSGIANCHWWRHVDRITSVVVTRLHEEGPRFTPWVRLKICTADKLWWERNSGLLSPEFKVGCRTWGFWVHIGVSQSWNIYLLTKVLSITYSLSFRRVNYKQKTFKCRHRRGVLANNWPKLLFRRWEGSYPLADVLQSIIWIFNWYCRGFSVHFNFHSPGSCANVFLLWLLRRGTICSKTTRSKNSEKSTAKLEAEELCRRGRISDARTILIAAMSHCQQPLFGGYCVPKLVV